MTAFSDQMFTTARVLITYELNKVHAKGHNIFIFTAQPFRDTVISSCGLSSMHKFSCMVSKAHFFQSIYHAHILL